MHGLFFLVCNVSSVLVTGRSRCTLFTFLHLIRYSFSKIILLLAVPLLAPHTTDSRILHCHLAVCRKEAFPFRWARVERCHALRVIRPWGTKLVLCHPQRGSQTIWSEKIVDNKKCEPNFSQTNQTYQPIKVWTLDEWTYLAIATIGIQRTDEKMRKTAITMHQCGQSLVSATPRNASHAG